MYNTLLQAYFILFYFVLHLSLLTCDSTCIVPVSFMAKFVPQQLFTYAKLTANTTNVEAKYLMLFGQCILLGDIIFVAILGSKFIAYVVRRFFRIIIYVIMIVIALKMIENLWLFIALLLYKSVYRSFFVSSRLSLIDILLSYLTS